MWRNPCNRNANIAVYCPIDDVKRHENDFKRLKTNVNSITWVF